MKTWRTPWFILSMVALSMVAIQILSNSVAILCLVGYLLVVVLSDRREIKELRSRLTVDVMTGLRNRAGLEIGFGRLYSLLSRQETGGHISVLYCDLDCFKTLNDTCGHRAGDEAIEAMAEILQTVFRRRDTILARSSQAGDEFNVILPNATKEEIEFLIRTVSEQMAEDERFFIRDSLRVTVSVGISTCQVARGAGPRQAVSEILEAQLRLADGEMQRCKRENKKAR